MKLTFPSLLWVVGSLARGGANPLAGTYHNPLTNQDDPDPGVTYDNVTDLYYAVTTSGDAAAAFPMWSSPDLAAWKQIGHVFPNRNGGQGSPTWGKSDFWAPELHFVAGKWRVYFVARTAGGDLSVGVASSTSDSITGPYEDSGKPLVHTAGMGQIDPTVFTEPSTGVSYVIWKTDGNAVNKPTPIWAAALAPNGTTVVGAEKELIRESQTWEGPLVEGPWVVLYQNQYFLFYSGNGYGGDLYALGVARAPALLGPYTKATTNPMVHTNFSDPKPVVYGPGHCSVLTASAKNGDGKWAVVYHAWNTKAPTSSRSLMLDSIVWTGSGDTLWPTVKGSVPSTTDQPIP